MGLEVEIEDEAWPGALPDVQALVVRAAEAALGEDRDLASGGLVILLTDDETVRDLNARFRGRDRATNVLSFPAAPMPISGGDDASGPRLSPLGDIVLAFGLCSLEAQQQNKALSSHLTHLVVHGVLHLLGRDHEVEAEAEAMEAEERQILAGLGIDDPYERPDDH
jgi:probable rRNA maturation factor